MGKIITIQCDACASIILKQQLHNDIELQSGALKVFVGQGGYETRYFCDWNCLKKYIEIT
jgi:hypothetical protein